MNRLLNHFKGDGLKAQLLKGATGTAGLKMVNMVLTLAVGILLARSLGPENYGIYAFVLSVITLLGLPTKAGLPTLIVRETAKYQLQEKWSNLRGLLTLANGFVVGFSVLVALVSAVVVWWYWGDEQGVKTSTFFWALLLLPLIAFGNIRGATLRGLRKVVQGQLPEEVVRPLVLILLVGGVFALGVELTPENTMQYTVWAALASFAVGAVLLIRAMPPEVRRAEPSYETKVWTGSLVPLSLITGIQIINGQAGIVLLGIFSTPDEVGLYKVAMAAAGLASVGLMVANVVLAPHITRMFHAQEIEKLQRLLVYSARMGFLASFPLLVLLIFLGEGVLGFLFGFEYKTAYWALVVLSIGQMLNAMAGSVGLVLKQINLEKKALMATFVGVAVNCILCLLLIPAYASTGAAIAAAAALAVWNLINWFYLYKNARLDSSILGIKG